MAGGMIGITILLGCILATLLLISRMLGHILDLLENREDR